MNVFAFLQNKSTGKRELVTPPLDKGIILPGVTRSSSVARYDQSHQQPITLVLPQVILVIYNKQINFLAWVTM